VDYYLNDISTPLDVSGDTNLCLDPAKNLVIESFGPAYEGVYYCRFNNRAPEPQGMDQAHLS